MTQSEKVSASNPIQDVASPYFLNSSDHPGAILVSTPLNGDNYPTWKRSMKMALNAKNKLGFVDGSVTQSATNQVEIQAWGRCNDMVLSWILNSIDKSLTASIIYADTARSVWLDLEERFSQGNNPRIFQLKRDITNFRQEQHSLAFFYNTLKSYWDELGTYVTLPSCNCGAISKCTCEIFKKIQDMHETERVYQFLMGLNETCTNIRSQILVMDPLPNVSKVYAIINQEEKQRLLHLPSINTSENVAMAANKSFQNGGHGSNRPHGTNQSTVRGKGRPKCDYCGEFGHYKEKCYELVGYPATWNQSTWNQSGSNKKASTSRHSVHNAANSVVTHSSVPTPNPTDAPIPGLSSAQYHQLLALLSPKEMPTANLAGKSSFLSCNINFEISLKKSS